MFELERLLNKATIHANELVMSDLIDIDKVREMFTEALDAVDVIEKAQSFKAGNVHTGEVGDLVAMCDSIEIDTSNWIKGCVGKFKFCAKIFTVGSTYGIKDGRISKLQICDTSQEHWGWEQTYLNYDRGWDVIPDVGEEVIDFLNKMLVALGDEALTDDDYIHIRKQWDVDNEED